MDMLKIPARTTDLEINIWRRKFKLAKPLQGVFDQNKITEFIQSQIRNWSMFSS